MDSGSPPGRAGLPVILCAAVALAAAALAAAPAGRAAPDRPAPTPVPGTAARTTEVPVADAAERLIGRLLGPTPIADDLRTLCDRIGGRPTGSVANDRAIDWFLERFRSAGVPKVASEPAPIPRRWDEGTSRATLLFPEVRPLHVVAMPSSPPTPRGGLEAAVIDVGEGEAVDFERSGALLKGAFALLSSRVIVTVEDLFGDYLRLPPIVERARAAGAAGLVVVGGRAGNVLYRHIATFDLKPAPIAMAIVAREEGLTLSRLAQAGETRLRLELDVREGPAYEARNVVAEIPGTDLNAEVVLLGAHVDSWELGTGALDNGVNCALVLDIARQMRALGLRPRRTVRFILFNGEEQGMFGSLAYVRAHRGELDRVAAMATVDEGTGRITGFSLGGRGDLRPLVEDALRPAAGLDASTHTLDAFVGTDNFDFLLEGVPNLVANQAGANYMEVYHASTDTFDKADLATLRANAAVTAALVWGLANTSERAPRQDRAAVQSVLDSTGVTDQLRTFSLWEDWAAGRRGRQD